MTAKPESVDYLTLLGYVTALGIKIYNSNQINCQFTDSEKLGTGGSMTVYHGYLVEDRNDPNCKHEPVAIKVPNANIKEMNRDAKAFKVLSDVRQELRMMKHLEAHPNIINIYGVLFQDLKPLTIVELAEESITDYLAIKKEENTPIDWETKARFCCEVADGLQALHTAKIVHGDLKGDNILLFKDYENRLIAKITDFGYSATTTSIERGGGTGGSLHFLAPECTKYAPTNMKKYENKPFKDKYSFGLFVWQVAKDGEIPYEEMDEDEIQKLKNTDKNLDKLMNELEKDIPHYFRNVIMAMTKYSPEKREALIRVREMMELDITSDASFMAAKKNLESYAKELPHDVAKADLSSIELMSIPLSLKTRIYHSYEKAAANGDADAMFMMAICHSTAFSVEVDKAKSLEWCIKAANSDSLDAITNIVDNYKIKDLPVKPEVAFPWYLKAAEKGYKKAIAQVYNCYINGNGVECDWKKAAYWADVYNTIASTSEVNMNIGETSLHRAARLGNVEAVRFLLEQRNTDINTKNKDGQTVLHTAAQHGHTELVKLLITMFGADVNARTNSNKTPLELAAGRGHVEVVRLFEDETVITMLDLSHTFLGSEEAHLLAESLNMYITLTRLILTDNRIGDEGACALAKCLNQSLALTHLNLWNNGIGFKGAYALAECLKQNTILTELNIGSNIINNEGACALAECLKQNSVLTQLDLEKCRIGDKGACALARYLKQGPILAQLNLGTNSIGKEGASALADSLKLNICLTELNLRYNSIGKESARAFAECLKQNSTLALLELGYSDIGDEGACALAECLKRNSALTQLKLGSNDINEEGTRALAECLKQNSTLVLLDLGNNGIGFEGAYALAECLKQNMTLTQLELKFNHVGSKGAYVLAECLTQNSTLTQLELGSNRIDDEGAFAMARCLTLNSALVRLSLSNNSIGEEGACALAEALKQNVTLAQLDLGYNKFTDETKAFLKQNSIFVL